MKCSLVIPTYKRQESLNTALMSVFANKRLPNEVLIIDDDSLEEEYIRTWRQKYKDVGVDFVYYKKDHAVHRRGLSESKNRGIELAQHEIIFYIDDDVVLEELYISALMDIWENNKDDTLFAVGGKITNNRKQHWLEKKLYNPLWGLTGEASWDVNAVGFQVWDESVMEQEKVYYIHGGVSSYKKRLLQIFPFKTFSGGRTGNEDVEQALHAKKAGYHCIYAPAARLAHYHEASGRENAYTSGQKESENRKEIFKAHCSQDMYHKVWFIWANIGWILRKVAKLQLKHAHGMLEGLYK